MRLALFCGLLLTTFAASPAQTTRPKITGIAFMRLYATDAAAADNFYGKTLGLARPQQRSAGSTQYVVNRHQWIEVITNEKPPSATSRMAAIAFTTADVKQMAAYLRSKGIVDLDSPESGELATHDPEGNLVIFVQQESTGPEQHRASETTPTSTATSHHIIHVGFIARDREKENMFWQGILGFKPYWHGGMTPDKTEWVSMQVPDGTDWLEYMLGASATPSLRESGVLDHFSLGTISMNTVMAQLQKNGCDGKDCTAIQMGKDGKIQLNMFDPDLTRVEFMEFKPAIEPCCSPFTGTQPREAERDLR